MALTANAQLTREEEVALYGEHIRLKAFYPTAVERLLLLCCVCVSGLLSLLFLQLLYISER